MSQYENHWEQVYILEEQRRDIQNVAFNLTEWGKEVSKVEDPFIKEMIKDELNMWDSNKDKIDNLVQKTIPSKEILNKKIQNKQEDLQASAEKLGRQDKMSTSPGNSEFAKAFTLPQECRGATFTESSGISPFMNALISTLKEENICGPESDLPKVLQKMLPYLHRRKELLDLPEVLQEALAVAKGKRLLDKVKQIPHKDPTKNIELRYRTYSNKIEPPKTRFDIDNKSNYITFISNVKGDNSTIFYRNQINVKDGIIITTHAYRTLDSRLLRETPEQPVSQIAWYHHKYAKTENESEDGKVGNSSTNLKINEWIRNNVANEESLSTLSRYVQKGEKVSLQKGTKAYYAAAGTPNCQAAFYLLEQHKEDYGEKEVRSIELMRNTKGDRIDIRIHIGDKQ